MIRAVTTTETLLAPLVGAPEESALVFDVDGVLAPIVARPELAALPEETRSELRRLADRYLLVACLSGRAGEDARRLVGVEGVTVVGNHGLELEPRAVELAPAIARFRDSVSLPVEDKGLSLTYHYREAADEAAAVRELERVAARARADGLHARWGRKVLEIRPPIDADKGTAVRALLTRVGARRALYAGDDATDLDAFAGLAAAGLDYAVRIAIASTEGPAELRDRADLVLESPAAFLSILRGL
jgi:trehalose 6-phosphate phosphatase